jgi:hypothetical protein
LRRYPNGRPKFNNSSKLDEWGELKERTNSRLSWDEFNLADIETKVFLLGIWKSFEELEENISLPEMNAIHEARIKEDYEHKQFLAAIKGIEMPDYNTGGDTFEDVKRRALGDDPDTNDIANLKGALAAKEGFGVGYGIGYEVQ